MIEIIDYGGGNIGSLMRCLDRLELAYTKVDSNNQPSGNHPVILPGVGAFGATMESLNRNTLSDRIRAIVTAGVPFLGICIGLQVLLESSEESPGVKGLGLISGRVVRFQCHKIPQIGWNWIESNNGDSTPNGYAYFVNSYYAKPDEPTQTLYQSDYEGPFCAAILHQNITAFQFHPEKSGQFGHELIRRWFYAL